MKVRFDNRQAQDPTRVKGVQVPYAPSKRQVAQWRWYLTLLIVAAPLLYLLWKLLMPYITVSAPGYISLEKVSINSTASASATKRFFMASRAAIASCFRLALLIHPPLLGPYCRRASASIKVLAQETTGTRS